MSQDHANRKKPVIGVAGGIGSGKTTVARILESLGAAVIDSDRLAHEELSAPEVVATLRRWWGDSVCTEGGSPDRRRIGEIVFRDASELDRLEKLLYPRIARRRDGLMERFQQNPKVRAIVIDAPKLLEAGVDAICDIVIFVEADRSLRGERVAQQRHWNDEELTRRENLQFPLDKKRASADHVVINHTDVESLRSQVERVFSSVLNSFT